jgi:hypothetical protein
MASFTGNTPIDLTPVHDPSGPARLRDLVPGRSADALAAWLAAQPPTSLPVCSSSRWLGSPAQDRGHRCHPCRGNRDGPLPRRGPGRNQARPDPPTHPAADPTFTGADTPGIQSTEAAASGFGTDQGRHSVAGRVTRRACPAIGRRRLTHFRHGSSSNRRWPRPPPPRRPGAVRSSRRNIR